MDDSRAFELIDQIDANLNEMVQCHFFNPEIFTTLDNVDASRHEIDSARGKIDEAVWLRLQGIAGSVYSGNLRRGEVSSLYDVVSRLGMHHTKVMIILLAFHQLANRDRDVEIIFAGVMPPPLWPTCWPFRWDFGKVPPSERSWAACFWRSADR